VVPLKIDLLDRLTEADVRQVRALLAAATSADGVAPVSEQVLLDLSNARPTGRNLLLRADSGELAGFAHATDPAVADPSVPRGGRPVVDAEAVVTPDLRGRGHGRALLEALAQDGALVRIWSHGDHPAARRLGAGLGYRVVRELQQLRRTVNRPDSPPLPEPALPAGATLRTFRPGQDDADWLRVNARAFSWHPEQGRMTRADLEARKAEPWFDPAGFLIAEVDGRIAGFHWTKVHPEGLGEVYAVGVDPDRHGGGLGSALTLAGLRHLAGLGLDTVLLYVEADNAPALKVYHRLGFSLHATDVVHEGPWPDLLPNDRSEH